MARAKHQNSMLETAAMSKQNHLGLRKGLPEMSIYNAKSGKKPHGMEKTGQIT